MIWTQGSQAAFTLTSRDIYFGLSKAEMMGKSSHTEVWGSHSGLYIVKLFWPEGPVLWSVKHAFCVCFGRCGGKFKGLNGVAMVQTSKVKLGGHCICDFGHVVDTLLKIGIFWTVLQTRTKTTGRCVISPCALLNSHDLVFCLMVMICPALCLLGVLHFIHRLSKGIHLGTGKQKCHHCKMSLIARSTVRCRCCPPPDIHGKSTQLMWLFEHNWWWREKTLTIFLSHMPVHQNDLVCKY